VGKITAHANRTIKRGAQNVGFILCWRLRQVPLGLNGEGLLTAGNRTFPDKYTIGSSWPDLPIKK
jgi:hypothetical protein